MGKHSKTQRLEAQRENLTALGDLKGLCPILREECLLHDDSSCAVHFCVEQSTHAQAVVFRDKIFRNVRQVRVNFTSAEARIMDTLIDLVVKCKLGQHVSPDDVPKGPVVSGLLRPGQAALVKDLHSYLAKRAKAQPVPSQKTVATPAPAADLRSPRVPTDGWTLAQAEWFQGTSWPQAWSDMMRPSTGVSETQVSFMRSLLTATVRLATGAPLQPNGDAASQDAPAAVDAVPADHPPRTAKERQLAWFRRYENLQGLCAYLMCCIRDIQQHGPQRAHVLPQDWSMEQAVAFRDRIWPVFPENRAGMSEAQVTFVTMLLDIVTGNTPLPTSVKGPAPTVSGAGADPAGREQQCVVASSDVEGALEAALSKVRAHHQAVAAEGAALHDTIKGLRDTIRQSDAANQRLQCRASELEAKLADTTRALTASVDRLKADSLANDNRAESDKNTIAVLRDQLDARSRELADARRSAQLDIDALKAAHRSELDRAKLSSHAATAASPNDDADRTALMELMRSAQSALGIATTAPENALPNPCLSSSVKCQALLRFEAGLRRTLSVDSIGAMHRSAQTTCTFAFHGTPASEAILCHGFDPAKRSAQQHGPGEYFSFTRQTAEDYARSRSASSGTGSPGVIVTLIIASQARRFNNGRWVLVDNPTDNTAVSFCLPLMVLRHGGAPLAPCLRCGTLAMPPGTAAVPAAGGGTVAAVVEFQNDRQMWTPMPATASATVLAVKAVGNSSSVVTVNGHTYSYDWQRMVQTNTRTQRERKIRIV